MAKTSPEAFSDIETGKGALALLLKDGQLVLDRSEMALYGGSSTGKIVADGSGAVQTVAARFDLHDIEAGPLFRRASVQELSKTLRIPLNVPRQSLAGGNVPLRGFLYQPHVPFETRWQLHSTDWRASFVLRGAVLRL